MRGHLDSLETVLNDMVTELKYHQQQVQITSAEKDTSGALLEMNIVKGRNEVLNEEYKLKQDVKRQNENQVKVYEKLNKQLDAINLDHNTENSRILALQRRIWDTETALGIPT